ncbi:MAG: alpha/beta fold hydrolase [Sporichthyaceae bacterium]
MRRVVKIAVVVTGAVGAVATALGTASATGTDRAGADPAGEWGACTDAALAAAGAKCGFVTVPLDRSVAGGRSIAIAVSRLPATGDPSTYRGPLLVNPGGPGESGLNPTRAIAGAFGAAIRRDYDLVGFDPRGVGASVPALRCGNDRSARAAILEPLTGPGQTPGGNEQTSLELARAYTRDCAAAAGSALPHLTSTDVVADLDAIRAALGAQRLNYYGFSYGTYLGQLYASTYPQRVGRMVLDSNIDPTTWGYRNAGTTAREFDRAARALFAWIAEHDATFRIGADAAAVEKAFYAIDRALQAGQSAKLTSTEWRAMLVEHLYGPERWAKFATLMAIGNLAVSDRLVEAVSAPGPTAPRAEAPGTDNENAAYYAAACGDSRWPAAYATWRADAFATAAAAPLTAWRLMDNYLPCLTWPSQKSRAVLDGSEAPPFLLASREIDGPTPLANSVKVRTLFPGSVLVVSREVGHIASGGSNACVNDLTLRYLRTGALPNRIGTADVDVWCAGVPVPAPAPAIAVAIARATAPTARPAPQKPALHKPAAAPSATPKPAVTQPAGEPGE